MHDTGCSGLVHWDDPEECAGEGVGEGFRMGNMCTPVADSCQCMAKQIQCCKVKKKRKSDNQKDYAKGECGNILVK